MSQDKAKTEESSSSPQSKKNATYERALNAFFEGGQPSQEQQKSLPDDVAGLSARRQAMIDTVLSEPNEELQLQALRQLRLRFGLPTDIRILFIALRPDDEILSLEALKQLEHWLNVETRGGQTSELLLHWAPQLRIPVEIIMLRSFKESLQSVASRCLSMIESV